MEAGKETFLATATTVVDRFRLIPHTTAFAQGPTSSRWRFRRNGQWLGLCTTVPRPNTAGLDRAISPLGTPSLHTTGQ